MTGNWETELRKLKHQFVEETMEIQKEVSSSKSSESGIRKLKRKVESLLSTVAKVFSEEGLTEIQRPHLHQHKNGYTLVAPIVETGVRLIILKLELELIHTKNGIALKVINCTPKSSPVEEKVMEQAICSEERIREEIRAFLIERQNIILDIKKRAK